MAKHNKKRNVGLLYEQLMRFASNCILENNKQKAKKSVDILCRHFKPGTALYKEFRLFNALVDSKVSSRDVARRIIEESKKACLSHDRNQLRKEKSHLIKEINHSLNSPGFYKEESSIKKEHANPLTLNIMIDKFKTKYESRMNPEQRSLFESYLFNKDDVAEKVASIKENVARTIKRYFAECDNSILIEKRISVEKQISSLNVDDSAESISKAMVLSSLANEMENKNVK